LTRVQAIAAETRHTYGSRRMAKPLQADDFAVGRDNAQRLMRQVKVMVQRREQRHLVTTDRRHGSGVAPHLLACQRAVEKPNQVWVGDITYVWTAEGWLSLGVLLDLYSRHVVG
jgi:putative transposase